MDWFYFALLAPFLYAIVNLLDDNLLHYVYRSPYLATMAAGLFGALPLLSRFFLPAQSIPLEYILLAEGAGLLTVIYLFFYFRGLESDSPSTVVALFSLATAALPFAAHFILHEQLVGQQIIGFVIVLVASLGLAVNRLSELKLSAAFAPVLIAAVFMDIVAIASKYVYNNVDFYSAYMFFALGMGLGGLGFFMLDLSNNKAGLRLLRTRIRRLLPIFIFTELIGAAAELTLNASISRGPVSLVKVIEGIQPVYVLLIALLLYPFAPKFFREAEEGHPIRKFCYMAVIIAGLAVISVSSKA